MKIFHFALIFASSVVAGLMYIDLTEHLKLVFGSKIRPTTFELAYNVQVDYITVVELSKILHFYFILRFVVM